MTIPKLSPQQPIAGTLKPTSAFLQYTEDLRNGIITSDDAILVLIDQLALTDAALAAAQADIIAANARQDDTDDALQDEIARINRILAGTENFTGIQVGGTNVKPFLDKTNGSALTNTTGLGNNVVTTPAVLAGAITPDFIATGGTVAWATESTEKTVQTLNDVAVTRGGVLILAGFVADFSDMSTGSPVAGNMKLLRNGVEIVPARVTLNPVMAATGASLQHVPQWSMVWRDNPGAALHDYTIRFAPGFVTDGGVAAPYIFALVLQG